MTSVESEPPARTTEDKAPRIRATIASTSASGGPTAGPPGFVRADSTRSGIAEDRSRRLAVSDRPSDRDLRAANLARRPEAKITAGDTAKTIRQARATPYRTSVRADLKSRRASAATRPMAAPTQTKCSIVQPAAVHTGELVKKVETHGLAPFFLGEGFLSLFA